MKTPSPETPARLSQIPCAWLQRWPARLALLTLGTLVQSLAFEPYGQAWLAWIAWAPLFFVLQGTRSHRAAFAWGWLAGILFFAVNIWWLWTATIPGTIALVLYFGLYWALAATVMRGLNLLDPDGGNHESGMADRPDKVRPSTVVRSRCGWKLSASACLIAAVWVASEWLRAYVARGFPWMLVGHSQSPLPAMCQIADTVGVFGVSFWVILLNLLILFAMSSRGNRRSLVACGATTAVVVAVVLGYGIFRLSEDMTYSGPRVMVVQPNHPHLPGGTRTVSREDAVAFHFTTTLEALRSESPDLIVWSETVMPPLNAEARDALRSTRGGEVMDQTHRLLGELTARAGKSLVTGANHVGGWIDEGNARVGTEIRNSVYFYGPDGQQSSLRYDKTQLVPFAERVAFRGSIPWLHRAFLWLSPPVASQPLVPGDRDGCTVFTVETSGSTTMSAAADTTVPSRSEPPYRFITPICLENIDSALIARMFRDKSDNKRADFLVNVSNDGWFHPIERKQHLQNVIFRSIESRVPAARATNTGISGFIDSAGRVLRTIPVGAEGTATDTLMLDRRVTFYTRHGDVFAKTCVLITVAAILVRVMVFLRGTRKKDAGDRVIG